VFDVKRCLTKNALQKYIKALVARDHKNDAAVFKWPKNGYDRTIKLPPGRHSVFHRPRRSCLAGASSFLAGSSSSGCCAVSL
jgi:hypothetical protein